MFKNKYFVLGIIIFFATFCVQDVFADGYSMTVSTGGPQSIDVVLGSDSKGTSISEDAITVNTTCRYGYNLTIGTTVNDNNLYLNGDSSNNTSGSYISPLSSQTALSEATNSWGYYFNRSTAPTASSTFSPVPASGSASIITELATPSASDISDSFSVYYGVTVSQPATPTAGAYVVPGTYKMVEDSNHNDGAIIYYFTLANNCMPYTINYSPTSTSTGSSVSGTGTMSPQEGYKDVQITLSPMGFTPPSGYEFKEWNTAQDGTGTSYADEDSITNLTTPSNSVTLYAIWWQPPKTIANSEYLQEVNYCPPSLPVGQTYTLKDSRDEIVYSVAKLADGNCWLLDNLMLDLTDSTTAANMDETNTNADSTSLDCLLGRTTGCSSPYTTDAVAAGIPRTSPTYARIQASYKNTTVTSYGSNNGKIGIYYNFCAASAGGYCNNTSSGVDLPDTLYDISGDICPAGWHIPTGGNTGEYRALYSAYSNNAANTSNAFSAALSGSFNQDIYPNPDNIGTYGEYWSSTYADNGSMFGIHISTSWFGYTGSYLRDEYGLPIRCIFNATAEPAGSRINLYNTIAEMSKGTQTAANLQATITKPTSSDPTTDTSNSGVYEYNSSEFGADTDGVKEDNSKATIYYYRGILDDATGTYGSDGDGGAYPNYVLLSASADSPTTSDTCWRIIRTTGSGGIKMIYNGNWTGSTCANATTNAQTRTTSYTATGNNNNRRVVRVGYTYNNSYASTSTGTNVNINTLFGSDSNYSNNTMSSNIKTIVEDWYTNNLSSYAGLLETNAGYCNDRSAFSNTTGTTSLTQLSPYGSSRYTNGAYFGAYARNFSTNRPPSLGCPRSTVDVYTTSSSSAGNKQLGAPIALITADELAFAGSGGTANQGSANNSNSFLRTGSTFLTMTPSYRQNSSSYPAYVIYLNTNGVLTNNGSLTTDTYGVRPVISLVEGAEAVSGTGTAVDPWVVTTP